MQPRTRINNRADREAQIIRAGATLAKEIGYAMLTRENVAHAAGVSPALLTNLFGTMDNFRDKLMQFAVDNNVVSIVADGLAARNSTALSAPDALKKQAVTHIARG